MKIKSLTLLIVCFILVSCSAIQPNSEKLNVLDIKNHTDQKKKVILIILDSLMNEPLQEVVIENKAPLLRFLMKKGTYYDRIISSYPTMSVVIDSTLLTGTYANGHTIPGLVWYNEKENRIVNYGSSHVEAYKLGARQYTEDVLYNLNNVHMNKQVTTIHEQLANNKVMTGSINALIHRGTQPQTLEIPKIIEAPTIIPKFFETSGPHYLSLGLFKKEDKENNHIIRLGINDEFSVGELSYLIKENELPQFTFVYLPDNDHPVHDQGPNKLSGIIKADEQLQKLFNLFPTWDAAVEYATWIVLGDSGQAHVVDDKDNALIDLQELFKDYQIASLWHQPTSEDQIVLAPNERMTYVYSIDPDIKAEQLARVMKQDDRIGFIAWKNRGKIQVIADKGKLTFKPGGELSDPYGKVWTVNGNLTVLDVTVEGDNLLFGNYPDAFSRLHAALNSHKGELLVADAKVGYEFKGESSPTHVGGGSHGSLHEQDSIVPMIVAGTKIMPQSQRIIDLKEWLIEILNQEEQIEMYKKN